MLYTVEHHAEIADEDWTVEIEAKNKPSAIAQVAWWFDVARYKMPRPSGKMSEYGFVRYKVAPFDWVVAT